MGPPLTPPPTVGGILSLLGLILGGKCEFIGIEFPYLTDCGCGPTWLCVDIDGGYAPPPPPPGITPL